MSASDPNRTVSHVPVEPGLPKTVEYPTSAIRPADGPADVVPGYELLNELGRGGMGVVYRARQIKLNRFVALKTTLASIRSDPKGLIRFLAEAEASAAIRHPNVVQVYDYGEHDGRPFMALEFLTGGTLAERLSAAPRLPARAAAELLGQVARGVAAAHALGIIHRDLKPANVLIDQDGVPKVTDFGLAKRVGGSDLTHPDAVMGTPSYMSPEQAGGRTKFVGPQADVWALGIMLYEALAGVRPFAADTLEELLARVLKSEPASLRSVGVPRDLELICFKCLAKDPVERYPTAAELAEDLERFVRGEPISVRPAGMIERTYKWTRRNPALAATGMLSVLTVTLLGFASGAAALWQRAESARAEAVAERLEAVVARGEAESARDAERRAKALAEQRAVEIARLNYLATIDLAGRSVMTKQLENARALLDDCEPTHRNWEWRYLQRLCSPERLQLNVERPTELEQKQFYFERAEFAHDSRRLFGFGGTEPILRVWDTDTGKLLESRPTGDPMLWDLSLSADQRRLLLFAPGSVRIWDVDTLQEVGRIAHRGREHPGGWLNADGSQVVLPGPRGEVRVYDVATGKELRLYRHPPEEKVWAVGFPDGKVRLITADVKPRNDYSNGTLRLRDVETDAVPIVLEGVPFIPNARSLTFGQYPITVQVSPEGHRVLVGGSSTGGTAVMLWDARTRKAHRVGTQSGAACFSADGNRVVCAAGRNVHVLSSTTGGLLREYTGHPDLLCFAVLSPDGKSVVAGGGQGQPIRVWDANGSSETTVISQPLGPQHIFAFSPDATRMLAPENDGTVREYDPRTGQEVRVLARFAKATSRIVYSRDGRRIATSVLNGAMGHPGQISVFDNATGRTEMEVPEEGRSSGLYGFTADGDALYLKQADTRIGEWDLTRRTWRRTLPKFDYIVAISPDGRLLLTDEGEGRAGLRDAATGELTVELESYPKVNSPDSIWLVAAFSPKGDRVAVACPDLRVRVWDTRTGKLASVVRDYAKLAKTVLVFSPDGARLVTFGLGMEMWDVETGRPTLPAGLVKHKGGAAAFSRDGRYLFIGGGARELLVRLDVGR